MIKKIFPSQVFQENLENYTIVHLIDSNVGESKSNFSEGTLLKLKTISKKTGSTLFIEGSGKNLVFLSLGEYVESHSIENIFRSFVFHQINLLEKSILLDFSNVEGKFSEQILKNAIKGIYLSSYKVSEWKGKPAEKNDEILNIYLQIGRKEDELSDIIREAESLAKAQMEIMRLVDSPSNFKTPQKIKEYCVALSEKKGIEIEVIEGEGIAQERLFALEAVGRGSEHPPVMIIMKYRSGKEGVQHLGLVGKGVTFDTGGISIKPSANLHMMKSDMGGAAAVIGAMEVISDLGLNLDVTVIVPLTENCVDAKSIKPGDVISSRSGKTIEIIDTDAEGRLILADGLFYLKEKYKPNHIIDLATLTGSTVKTFGYECAALFSNDDKLSEIIRESGNSSGERVWPLPLWKEYESALKSDVAEVANFSGKPINGAIDAALFLQTFIDGHKSWAHLDIAGVAFKGSEYASMRSATGYGVNLLLNIAKRLVK